MLKRTVSCVAVADVAIDESDFLLSNGRAIVPRAALGPSQGTRGMGAVESTKREEPNGCR
jgi:hypothetical protein